MLARTAFRLWTPQYFRGNALGKIHLGKRRLRIADPDRSAPSKLGTPSAPPPSYLPDAAGAVVLQGAGVASCLGPLATHRAQRAPGQNKEARGREKNPTASPFVRQAQEYLVRLKAFGDPSQASASEEAARHHTEFLVRQRILGPLRGLLPIDAAAGQSSAEGGALPHRFQVIPAADATLEASAQGPAAPPLPSFFDLEAISVFLQLYEKVRMEDGQLLKQIMSELHRQLFVFEEQSRSSIPRRQTRMSPPTFETQEQGREKLLCPTAPQRIPLAALLHTMSLLGLVEEAVLELVTSCAVHEGSTARRGLLYRQLPLCTTEELVQLLVTFRRFGHHHQPSMKSVIKALRASLYNKSTAVGLFYHRTNKLKKRYDGRSTTSGLEVMSSERPATPDDVRKRVPGIGQLQGDGVVERICQEPELCSLAVRLNCSRNLVCEALTTMSTTVYRRRDVVAFLSDLLAVVAVTELTVEARASREEPIPAAGHPRTGEEVNFILSVSQQLLRAAKLTETMELPQLLLSEVFAWSTTLSGKGVLVDGGEDSRIPSDRVVYYDHVTADLVKVGRVD